MAGAVRVAIMKGGRAGLAGCRDERRSERPARLAARDAASSASPVSLESRRGHNFSGVRVHAAALRAASSQTASPAQIGGAAPGLYRQEEERPERPLGLETAGVTMTWEEFMRLSAMRLTPPTLLPPGALTLRPPPGLPPSLLPGPSLPTPPGLLIPPPSAIAPQAGEGAPELPSRLPLLGSGRFSVGLRLGFPELESTEEPGAPPSRVAELLRQGEIIDQQLTGKVPGTWEAIDKGKLAQAAWGIFSTKIAPDAARRLAGSLSTRAGPAGWRFELDLTLLADFSGAGLSFTVRR